MKKITRKLLALVMALAMSMALIPAMAQAAGNGITIEFASDTTLVGAVGATGKARPLIAAVARNGSVTDPDGYITCESSDPSIATVEKSMKNGEHARQQGVYWKFDVNPLKVGSTTIIVSSAEDPKVQEIVSVTVVDTLVTVKQKSAGVDQGFKLDAFNALEDETIEAWSGRNHSFTYKEYGKAVGPKLETVLTAAGVEVDKLADDQLIQFTPSAGTTYQGTFTVKEILRDKRYYFPNSISVKDGEKATTAQTAGAVEIPTILANPDNSDARLVFGQVAPNERSNSVSIKGMTSGGTIEILDKKAGKLAYDVKPEKVSGGTVAPGQEIKLDSATILTTDIYYTTDGSQPSRTTAALYNYRTKEMSNVADGGLKNAPPKAPAKEGKFILKVMQAAYGNLDSNVVTYEYNVQAVKKGTIDKVSGTAYTVTKPASGTAKGTVTYKKAKNAKSVSVPKTVTLYDGKTYAVTTVGAKAFTGKKIRTVTLGANVKKLQKNAFNKSKATKIVVKTKKLTKKSVKGSLKGSKVKRIQVKVGSKKLNKKYAKKYKKYFTRSNAGRRVTVK